MSDRAISMRFLLNCEHMFINDAEKSEQYGFPMSTCCRCGMTTTPQAAMKYLIDSYSKEIKPSK